MSTEGQIKEILKEHPTMSYNDIAKKDRVFQRNPYSTISGN